MPTLPSGDPLTPGSWGGLSRTNAFEQQDVAEAAARVHERFGPGRGRMIANVRTYDPLGEVRWKGIEIWTRSIKTSYANAGPGHKYLHIAGQYVEWTGTDPIAWAIESVWFGEGWAERLAEFKHAIRTDPYGTIEIPNGEVSESFLRSAEFTESAEYEGVDSSITIEEHSHLSWHEIRQHQSVGGIGSSLSAEDRAAVQPQINDFEEAARDAARRPTTEIAAALRLLDTALLTQQAAIDVTAMAGVNRRNGIILARAAARRGAPAGVHV
jgi:hypothetical protein